MRESDRYGQPWELDEITLALYVYCQVPFAKTKANNPMVKALATHLGRTPASVARKLGNFGSFDPTLAARSIVGLGHASKSDRELWEWYAKDWSLLVDAAVKLWNGITSLTTIESERTLGNDALRFPSGPSEAERITKVRLHQTFFRRAVLASYDDVCCACGLDIPTLLTASHIVPWAHDERLRADPTNGLCLCAIHDRAFDRGLISVSDGGEIVTSPILARYTSSASHRYLAELHGLPLAMPRRFAPKSEYVAWHRKNIFVTE